MFSIETILNPAPSGREASQAFKSSPSPAFSPLPVMNCPPMPPMRTTKEPSNLAKSKLRGPMKYPPFENIGEQALYEIRRFRIVSFGRIHQTCSHIPYNSGKKDFYEKTGRESFEVFRYEFTAPGQSTEYTVMWDYNVGLVRMTPFFKCCQYGKTMPAKMLNLNPGLKEITHSITGGSITAQGYWMPYQCARAVCATFCYHIAGALIPLFGPTFPSECIPPETPEFGRMVIDPQLVIEATREAEIARRLHMNTLGSSLGFVPRSDPGVAPTSYAHIQPHDDRKHPFRPRLTCDPSWVADDRDAHYYSGPNSASSTGSGHYGYMVTSRPSSSWTVNHHSPQYDAHTEPNPYLTAVPKIPPLQAQTNVPGPYWTPIPKRRLDYDDSDHGYRSSASPTMMGNIYRSPLMMGARSSEPSPPREIRGGEKQRPSSEAATALVLLGMRNEPSPPQPVAPRLGTPAPRFRLPEPWLGDSHRSKRQRANSH
ncbi:hypothetical protein B0T10DRAFT_215968 [Thelonectria olida]|uniref:HTH APSES-type domain-containing protein n=1 Tax=Thelonectria olida TaxID=1576542 RepID=A0A9P8WE50_9HYPO|nr:hypothetical protein B0T10DRAFT_215968 [Thelonectria olida]